MRFLQPPKNSAVQRQQLLDAIDLLDHHGVNYHMEGGTLLGVVRDGDLLPWDKDTDISIMSSDVPRIEGVLKGLKKRGWRLSKRMFKQNESFASTIDLRLVKVKDYHLKCMAGRNTLDIFVKYLHEGSAYWIASSNVMRVSAHHYQGYEEIDWAGRKVKVPIDYEGYLEAKYGDWRTPVKDWHCDKEQTIIRPRETQGV